MLWIGTWPGKKLRGGLIVSFTGRAKSMLVQVGIFLQLILITCLRTAKYAWQTARLLSSPRMVNTAGWGPYQMRKLSSFKVWRIRAWSTTRRDDHTPRSTVYSLKSLILSVYWELFPPTSLFDFPPIAQLKIASLFMTSMKGFLL